MNKTIDIVSLGSIYLDVISTEFPFDTALTQETETVGGQYQLTPGGSAVNIAKITASLGLKPAFIGKIGNDYFGNIVSELLQSTGIAPHLIRSDSHQTNTTASYVNSKAKAIMATSGTANSSLEPDEVIAKLEELLPQSKYLYLGGYFKLKKFIPYSNDLVNLAHKNNVQIILDHGRINKNSTEEEIKIIKELVHKVDIYLPSNDEFLEFWDFDTIESGIESIFSQNKDQTVIIKQAESGSTGSRGGEIIHTQAFPVAVINSVGAGDAFNAGFIKAQIDSLDFQNSLKFANVVAALKISKPNLPTQEEALKLFNS